MIDALLPLSLGFIMFSLGISLQPADFVRVFSRPRAIAIGLLMQIVALPLLAFALLKIFGLGGEMAVGVMILAACPGGISAGLLTLLAGGETALSISLTALTSLGVLITLPVTVGLALEHFAGAAAPLHLPVMRSGGGIFLITILPVLLGMALRQWRQRLTLCLEKPLAQLSTGLFILIVVGTFISQRDVILLHLAALGPLLLTLNLAIMGLGFAAAGLGNLNHQGRIAIAMECGLHNAALGIFVATTLLQAPTLSVPSVLYAFLMNFTAFGLVGIRNRILCSPARA
ncbi:MAG: bile acid:sodium symporter family protein [Bacteroidota bacterium]